MMNKTPLKDVPRIDRENAIKQARSQAYERYYRLRKEMDAQEDLIRSCDQQLMVLQGLELPVADATE